MLYPVLNKKSPIPLSTKIQLFKMYVLPILTYAGAAWASYVTKTQWKNIEAVQTIGLRFIMDTPNYIHNEILLKQSRATCLVENIRAQAKSMFYRN